MSVAQDGTELSLVVPDALKPTEHRRFKHSLEVGSRQRQVCYGSLDLFVSMSALNIFLVANEEEIRVWQRSRLAY